MLGTLKKAWSGLLFTHVTPLIRRGRTKALEQPDMPPLPEHLDPRRVDPGFQSVPLDGPWRFLARILWIMRPSLRRMGLMMAICGASGVVGPLLVHRLILLIQSGDAAAGGGTLALAIAGALCLASIGEALSFQHYIYAAISSTQMIMNGLNDRIYRHALALNRASRLKTPIGDVVNYMGTDTDSVAEITWVAVELTYSVLLITVVTTLLFQYLGIATLAALGLMTVLSPLTKRIAKRFTSLDDEIMAHRDRRVSQVSQVLSGIRIVKFFAWGERVLEEIRAIRHQEVGARRRLAFARALSLLFYVSASTLVSVAAFGTYVALGNELDAATVFASMGLFALLEYPFGNLTNFISQTASAKVSAIRISGFLREEVHVLETKPASAPGRAVGFALAGVSARYADATTPVLKALNFEVRPGESLAVVGPVGSGKSSLLLALLGEIPLETGTRRFLGVEDSEVPRTAFVPQEAFVQNGSLRDNILFGQADGEVEQAIEACALSEDVARLPGGLLTEIGEHGVNLSGGQKQRVCLARAMVARPGLALLDDPLAAVDERTEDEIVDALLFGALSGVTRIVVTHRLKHLERFDRVLFLENGEVQGLAPFKDLLARSPRFGAFVSETMREESKPKAVPAGEHAKAPAADGPSRVTEDEDREQGAVKAQVYFDYLWAMGGAKGLAGGLMVLLLLASTGLITFLPVVQNTWLSVWTDKAAAASPSATALARLLAGFVAEPKVNVLIFGLIGLGLLVAFFGQNLLWSLRAVSAGRTLHDDAMRATLAAPLRFFDSTPVGRVLNRFSRDVDSVERNMPWSFENTIRALFATFAAVAVLASVFPSVLLVIVPVCLIFYYLQGAYRASAREAQRLTSITRSPRFAHFKETLTGLTVIRSFHRTAPFLVKFQETLAENQRMFHSLILLNRWFSIRVPLASSLLSLAVGILVMLGARSGVLAAGVAGLVLIYSMRFWEHLNWSVRSFSEVESRMTSVERLKRYAAMAPEPDTTRAAALAPGEAWPTLGQVSFREVTARYAEHLPDVLREVSFEVPGGAKVGLIGRTGSGKSTAFQVLFRFLEVRSGRVEIDGKDIAGIPLERLRRSLAVIPQDPTLFKGTLRENLDRFAQHDDAAIWQALARVHLKTFVEGLPSGLLAEVKENGWNFSQGQRQLFCLARALLVDARIIVMDEATASVDVETDILIQETIRRECAGRTLIIIAHRLNTIKDCDLIVELEDGKVSRQGPPQAFSLVASAVSVVVPVVVPVVPVVPVLVVVDEVTGTTS